MKPIRLIQEGAFHGLQSLHELNLTYCDLKEMPPLDHVRNTLGNLILTNNILKEITPNYFPGFARLTRLDLSKNLLSTLPDFSHVAQTLYDFSATTNKIAYLSPSLTSVNFPMLFSLDIGRDKIKRISLSMLSRWPKLAFLYIYCNLIESLDDMSQITRKVGVLVSVCI